MHTGVFIHRFHDDVVYSVALLNLSAAVSQSFRAGREVVMKSPQPFISANSSLLSLNGSVSAETGSAQLLGRGLLLKTGEVTFR